MNALLTLAPKSKAPPPELVYSLEFLLPGIIRDLAKMTRVESSAATAPATPAAPAKLAAPVVIYDAAEHH